MVTDDVSEIARQDLEKYYDRVINVNYIEISKDRISHRKNENIKYIYSKTFTKLNVLKFVEYEKIVMLDSDLFVIDKNFFSIFDLKTPSSPYQPCNETSAEIKFVANEDKKICEKLYPNNLIFEILEKENIPFNAFYMETAVCLLKPSLDDFDKIIKLMNNDRLKLQSDSTLLGHYYKNQWHNLPHKYLGRWKNINDKDIYVVHCYGYEGKPWDINKFDKTINFDDCKEWMKLFLEFYEKKFKKNIKSSIIEELYNFLSKKKDQIF